MKFRPLCVAIVATAALGLHELAQAQVTAIEPRVADVDDDLDLEKLAELSIEDLMNIEVFSVAGIQQDWFSTPSAISVITADDIRRSGHRTLAEALRLAPGMFVGRTNASSWIVGARGFTGGLANKNLVMIDGRTVYDPLFSGTFWDVQDVMLEDVDRIEVIRGPGATLWGANAVNGVINVVTQSAKDTQGWLMNGIAGTDMYSGAIRYGGKAGDNAWYRVWGKYFDRDHFVTAAGDSAHDDWDMAHGGFRLDMDGDDYTTFTFQTDVYTIPRKGESVSVPVPDVHLMFLQRVGDGRAHGGNALFRIKKETPEGEGWSVQTYYDRTDRVQSAGFEVSRDTADIDFRHYFNIGERNEFIWGVGYRYTADSTEPSLFDNIILDPADRTLHTFNAFIQDTFTLIPDRLFVMGGSKFEHNDMTGFEFQPSGRMWWTPNDRQTIWGAVSRPVRVPSRIEQDASFTFLNIDPGLFGGGPPTGTIVPVRVVGDPDLDAEEVLTFEVGHRMKVGKQFVVDTSLFYNEYEDLIALLPTIPTTVFNNDGDGEGYGGELAVAWNVADNWRLEGAYSYTRINIHGPVYIDDEGNNPRNMAQIRSYLDLTKDIEFNSALYYVDSVATANVPSYLRLDLGLIWRPNPNLEIGIWGQNLLDPQHPEASQLEIERAGYLTMTLRF